MSQANNIGWIRTGLDLSELYDDLAAQQSREQTPSITLSPQGFLSGIGLKISSVCASAKEAFKTAFNDTAQANNTRNFYHIDTVPEDILQNLTADPEVLEKPAIGLYNPDTQDVLILEKGAFNYGFINAMVLGSFSKFSLDRSAYQYAHAACLSINGKGALIVGDHKAGKSTLISKILSEAEGRTDIDLGIVSDDWVMLDKRSQGLVGVRVSEEYRLDEQTVANPMIGLSRTFNTLIQKYKPTNSDKASIPVSVLCNSMGHRDISEHGIDVIVVMDPAQSPYTAEIDPKKAIDIMLAATANVVPLSKEEKSNFRNFWEAQFATHRCLSINNRHEDAPLHRVAEDIIKLALT